MAYPQPEPYSAKLATECDMDDENSEDRRSPTIMVPRYPLQISRPRHIATRDITDINTAGKTKSWLLRIFLWTCIVALLVVCLSFYVSGSWDAESVLESMKTPVGSMVLSGILTCSVLFL